MRILLLSFYYPPDLCAGSFRAQALVNALVPMLPQGSVLDVLTTVPNRYSSFSADAPAIERQDGGVTIQRIALPAHQSGMLDQSRAFLAFAKGVRQAVQDREYDIVVGTSSRLMTAVLAAHIARAKRARLYLDIRDIFVDTIKDVLAAPVSYLARPFFSQMERWAIRSADRVNLVSRGFEVYFQSRYANRTWSYFTNGIDEEFLQQSWLPASTKSNDVITVLYAGNIGEGQGLHAILPELAKRTRGRLRFLVIGDGGRKNALVSAIESQQLDNIQIVPPVSRERLAEYYRQSDILFLHLNDYPAFEKVLPSKLFEYAATGKPIWAGVAGYAKHFVMQEIDNAVVFPPCDALAAEQVLAGLVTTFTERTAFIEQYARTAIMHRMALDILSVARGEA